MLSVSLISSGVAAGKPPAGGDVEACSLAFEQGQGLRQKGSLLEARDQFSRCARAACPRVIQSPCARWHEEVTSEIPKIHVEIEGNEPAEVILDGAPAGKAPVDLEVAPGEHQLLARSARGDGLLARVSVGPKGRASITLKPFQTAPPASAPAATTAAQASPSRVAPIALLAVGAVALGAGGWLGASSYSKAQDLRGSCAPRCPSSDVDAVRSRLRVADVLMGIGALAAGAGVYLMLRGGTQVSAAAGPGAARVDATFVF